jgi:hypothetical protein
MKAVKTFPKAMKLMASTTPDETVKLISVVSRALVRRLIGVLRGGAPASPDAVVGWSCPHWPAALRSSGLVVVHHDRLGCPGGRGACHVCRGSVAVGHPTCVPVSYVINEPCIGVKDASCTSRAIDSRG